MIANSQQGGRQHQSTLTAKRCFCSFRQGAPRESKRLGRIPTESAALRPSPFPNDIGVLSEPQTFASQPSTMCTTRENRLSCRTCGSLFRRAARQIRCSVIGLIFRYCMSQSFPNIVGVRSCAQPIRCRHRLGKEIVLIHRFCDV